MRFDKKRATFFTAGLIWALTGATSWAQLIAPQPVYPAIANAPSGWSAPYARRPPAASAPTAAAPTAPPQKAADKWRVGRVEALFVAVQNYNGAGGLKSLTGCANDASKLKAWFDSAYAQNDSASTILCDVKDAGFAATAAPNRAEILDALNKKASVDCDRLLVTFAGHGVNYGGKSFFCPLDVKGVSFDKVDKGNRGAVLEKGTNNNLLAVEDVLDALKKAKAKEVVVIFDACRDGDERADNFTREFADLLKSDDAGFQRTNGGFFVLTSCSTGEVANEITVDGKKYGAFTYSLVEGLSGKADFAECCDGYVTLNEAYNYARSKVGRRGQTPELFMASTQMKNLPTMTRVALDGFAFGGAPAKEVDAWSDQEFLLRSGYMLCEPSWPTNVLRVGKKTLDAVLERAPNNSLAWELRGSARRSLGDFEGALSDLEQAGMKLQVYVKSLRSADKGFPAGALPPRYQEEWSTISLFNENGEKTGEQAETFDLLTVTKVRKDKDNVEWFFVAEKNNVPLGARAGWAKRDELIWNFSIAANIVNKSKLQPARIDGRSIASGNMASYSYRDNPRPAPRNTPAGPRF